MLKGIYINIENKPAVIGGIYVQNEPKLRAELKI